MSVNGHEQPGLPDWSEPRVPKVRLTHRNIHFLIAPGDVAMQASVIVGLSHRNHPSGLNEALRSAMAQDMADDLAFLVLDDSSDEGWMQSLHADLLSDPRLVVAAGHFGSPTQSRNGLLDLVDECFPNAKWVARLDADDRFAEPSSLRALVQAGDQRGTLFVIGSNRLSVDGELLPAVNWAMAEILLDQSRLNGFIQAFCRQQVPNELPSCNLVLRTCSGIRYPNANSAEDHWLVAGLLMNRPNEGCVVTEPAYAVYSLDGVVTQANQKSDAWAKSRLALAQAAEVWHRAHMTSDASVLGWGQEGVVWRDPSGTFKSFYPYSLTYEALSEIRSLAASVGDAVIAFDICDDSDPGALIRLDSEPLQEPGRRWPLELSRHFLQKLYRAGVVTSNVKRDNLRITASGTLQYIDIGRDIVRLTASRFLDCAARLYAIGELGWSDHELARRRTPERQVEALSALPGFDTYYGELMRSPQGARQGVHWIVSLMVWVAVLLVVYIAAKQLRLTGNGAAVPSQQAASTQPAPNTAPPQRPPMAPMQQPAARNTTPPAGVNKCVINGQTVYTEAPCGQAMRALVGNAPTEAPGNTRQREMEEAAAAAKRAEEQLARQWDQRMAQRDRDLAAEAVAVQQQVGAVNAECARLKRDRDGILRLSVTTQQMSPWRDNLNYIRKRMNELHC